MRALADSWQATAVSPIATQETPTHDAAKATDPATGSPPPTQASGREHAEREGDQRRLEHGGGQLGVATDGRAAEQLGAAGLLLGAGVAADQDQEQQRREDGVQHGQLRHRQLARAA